MLDRNFKGRCKLKMKEIKKNKNNKERIHVWCSDEEHCLREGVKNEERKKKI